MQLKYTNISNIIFTYYACGIKQICNTYAINMCTSMQVIFVSLKLNKNT